MPAVVIQPRVPFNGAAVDRVGLIDDYWRSSSRSKGLPNLPERQLRRVPERWKLGWYERSQPGSGDAMLAWPRIALILSPADIGRILGAVEGDDPLRISRLPIALVHRIVARLHSGRLSFVRGAVFDSSPQRVTRAVSRPRVEAVLRHE